MTGPIIKIHAVPDSFRGIDDVIHKQSIQNPDIILVTDTLYPIEEAYDALNIGNPGYNEPDSRYKIKLIANQDGVLCPYLSSIANKVWLSGHYNLEPRIFLKKNYICYNNVVWEYTFIPPYDEFYNANYTIETSGIKFTASCLANDPTILNYDVYASFFYWENIGYVHPQSSNVRGYFCSHYDDFVNYAPVEILYNNQNVTNSGNFLPDEGIFEWVNAPSGVELTLTGFYHTWQRLTNNEFSSLQFKPGECSPSGISDRQYLVKDFTDQGPWYRYTDIKISNESPNTNLEKVFLKPVLRGKTDANGYIYEGWAGYLDINTPWDIQIGQAEETIGYTGKFDNTTNVVSIMMWERDYCWASGVNPYSINPNLPSGLNINMFYGSDWKFAIPCSSVFVPQIITYYRSSKCAPDGSFAFAKSSDVIYGENNCKWITQQPRSAEFKVLSSGTFAVDGFPCPDAMYIRVLYTLRNFDYVPTNGTNNYSDWNTSKIFNDVTESDGLKSWTLQVEGTYYE